MSSHDMGFSFSVEPRTRLVVERRKGAAFRLFIRHIKGSLFDCSVDKGKNLRDDTKHR